MIPIDGSVPISGAQPAEPAKGALSIEPPRQLTLDETPATHTPNASDVLKNVTSFAASESGRQLLGEAIHQGTRNPQ